ncbi:MAG: methyl-accepting chemotaxis protein [Treponema sp.]|jgi:methyl-accepting chemotaxis protein|nr:methyl-accepting chemotaxis protein [Treponema sp.]
MKIRSLKTRFFLLFTGLGILVALGVGLIMYIQYDMYITHTYRDTLERTALIIEGLYPIVSDPGSIVQEGITHSASFWKLMGEMKHIVDTCGFAYIYLLEKDAGGYRFCFDTDYADDPETPQETLFKRYEDYPEEIDTAYQNKTLQISSVYTDEWGTFVSAFLPIVKGGAVVSILALDYEVSFIKSLERRALIALFISFVLAAGISASLAFTVAASLIKPIHRVITSLKTIAAGDLTQKVEAVGKDELGEMMYFLNQTQDSIKSLVLAIEDKADSLSAVGNELSAMMTQSAAAIHQISATTQGMKAKALTQAASVTETNATMEQIVVNIGHLNKNIEEQAESVSQSSAAIEEMTANITAVTQSLIQNERNVQNLSAASEKGHIALQQVSTDIQGVAKESERLLEINQVIENIASQTNLLSMNAAIEAAHAGEVGKGFAVVAGEIRKLAESSSEQAKTVSAVLKKIKESLDGISDSTTTALNHFEAIDTGVKTVSDHEGRIRSAMEEQDTESREILETVSRSKDITQNVRRGSQEMLTGSQEVIGESQNLEALTVELTNGMNETALGMNQINTAVTRIQEISQENKQSIEALIREITRFKIVNS